MAKSTHFYKNKLLFLLKNNRIILLYQGITNKVLFCNQYDSVTVYKTIINYLKLFREILFFCKIKLYYTGLYRLYICTPNSRQDQTES